MKIAIQFILFSLVALSSVMASPAHAILDLNVKEKLQVFKSPNTSSKVVTTLVRGDKVVISPEVYSGFRKVLVTYDGKRQAGYIPMGSMKISTIEDRNRLNGSPMIEKRSFGAFGAMAFYTTSGETALELEGFPDANLEAASGFRNYFGVSYSLPVKRNWVLNLSFASRQIFVKGTGAVNSVSSDTLEQTQNATSFGAFAKSYGTNESVFWLGFGVELALVNTTDIKVEGSDTNLTYEGENPTYILGNVGFGFDIEVYENIFVVPEFRGGAGLISEPLVAYFDVIAGVHYVY